MTAISTAAPDWLALRAAADDAARSADLAARLARLVEAGVVEAGVVEAGVVEAGGVEAGAAAGPVVLHDLGAGTGAMTRWLAPRLPGPQRWVLHDGDPAILTRLEVASAIDAAGGPVTADVRVEHLADLASDTFAGAAAVTASALLDVVTRTELDRIVAACVAARVPALFSLTVTGSVRIEPSTPVEAAAAASVSAAFDDHQRRDAHGRTRLGPDAVPHAVAAFAAVGWHVRRAATPWRLGPDDRQLIVAWLEGWLGAAVEQQPGLRDVADTLGPRWRAQAAAGQLSVTVAHEDVLAWPA
ncbi:SAM-dependent methyltransferase [Microbacterium sp.]|uniref:SAM-dependent methyltransferase n=1 Tax=Microbacterium sp. TaxID=51671 RepID=UPI003A8E12B7